MKMPQESDEIPEAADPAARQAPPGRTGPATVETSSHRESSSVTSGAELTERAERIVQDHVLLAVIAGFIPGPGIDIAAAFADQVTMIKRLSTLYDVPFRGNIAKSLLASFLTSLGGVGAAGILGMSFVKSIPIVGTLVGITGTSVSLGAFTYGVGKVFQEHFAAGGTLIDLNPRAYRDYFRDMTRRGRNIARDARRTSDSQRPERGMAAGAATGS
jgi:uncharacterized protein (DUF697 family)